MSEITRDRARIDDLAEGLLRKDAVWEMRQHMAALAPDALMPANPGGSRYPPRREGTARRAATAAGTSVDAKSTVGRRGTLAVFRPSFLSRLHCRCAHWTFSYTWPPPTAIGTMWSRLGDDAIRPRCFAVDRFVAESADPVVSLKTVSLLMYSASTP